MSAKGWECPKCGNVYAPWMTYCAKCNRRPVAFPMTGAPRYPDTRKYAQSAPKGVSERMR